MTRKKPKRALTAALAHNEKEWVSNRVAQTMWRHPHSAYTRGVFELLDMRRPLHNYHNNYKRAYKRAVQQALKAHHNVEFPSRAGQISLKNDGVYVDCPLPAYRYCDCFRAF
jgi:hypothetical protein